MIISLVLGTIIGALIDIDGRLSSLGDKLQKKREGKNTSDNATFSQGFVTASLLFCVGAMTIVGSMNAGISGDNQMLYTKSLLDLISSSMLAASLGFGVMAQFTLHDHELYHIRNVENQQEYSGHRHHDPPLS
jgi:uncharacterized membrane protein YqgA involved in biofilm formation